MRRGMLMGLAVVAIAVAGCGSSSDGGGSTSGSTAGASTTAKSSAPIQIGVMGPFTGDYASYGEASLSGVQAWLKANGDTIDGRKVEIKQIDDGCDVATGIAAFRRDAKGLTAMVGPGCSSTAKAVGPLLVPAKIPAVHVGQSSDVTGDWLFRAAQPTGPSQEAFGQYVFEKWKKDGVTKVALLHDTSDFSAGAPDVWKPIADKSGMKIVNTGSFDLGTTDFTSVALKVKQSGAQGAILQTYGPEQARIAKQFKQLGMKIQMAGNTDTASPDTLKAAAGALDGTYFGTDYIAGAKDPGYAAFDAAWASANPGKDASYTSWEGWLAMGSLMGALQQPGGIEGGQKLHDVLASGEFDVAGYKVGFTPQGDQKTVLVAIGQIQAGKAVPVDVLKLPRDSFGS